VFLYFTFPVGDRLGIVGGKAGKGAGVGPTFHRRAGIVVVAGGTGVWLGSRMNVPPRLESC
jgi:hypothetical protein